jgi:hypothetical protein
MSVGKITQLAILMMLPFAWVACREVVREGRAPVFLVIDSLQGARGAAGSAGELAGTLASDVITNVTSPEPCSAKTPCPTVFADRGQVVLRLALKDIGPAAAPAAPSTNNEVTINRYRVAYRRSDGRNAPGVDVPFAFDGAATGTVPAGGTLTLTFELVRVVAKEEPPLVQLVTGPSFITTIADVTFYGSDRVGNEVAVTGSIQIDFGNFGDH